MSGSMAVSSPSASQYQFLDRDLDIIRHTVINMHKHANRTYEAGTSACALSDE